MRITICGQRWRVQIGGAGPGLDGKVEHPKQRGKRIFISKAATEDPKLLMETAIHEGLHAADWSKDEEWVTRAAEDLTRLLRKLGFTKTE